MTSPLPVWDRLDFSRDAILEASAGTGKTYALEQILLRLVGDLGLPLEKILVVTFTEKAAGELAARLRSALSSRFDALPPASPARPRLAAALRAFDDASISTIHSFCQRVLREYAFENGLPMSSEVVADTRPTARKAVLSVLRSPAFRDRWASDFASLLGGADASQFVETVAASVARYRSETWDAPAEAFDPSPRARFLLDLFTSAVAVHRRLVAEASLLSYDEMIAKTADIVALPSSAPLRAKLRDALHVALVDEFQDTDALQWSIFRTLFSRSSAPPPPPSSPDAASAPIRCLVAVGDPKQAIYSFRNADIDTYLAARAVLSSPATGQLASLSVSYRSPAPLLDAFNRLFSAPGWFDPAPGPAAIAYSPVSAPASPSRYLPSDPDATGRAPVTLLESLPDPPPAPTARGGGWANRDLCLPVFARNAAAEIKRLLDLPEAVPFRAKDGTLERIRFRPGDFCFLVRAETDAAPIQRALDDLGIRHSYYKEKGLCDSPEAESVLALLDFVARPDSRGARAAAFLSPFFAVPPSKLDDALASPPPGFADLVKKWSAFAADRQWSRLFDSFVYDTEFWHPASPSDAAFDRRFAGVRRILDDLLAARASSALSVEDFAEALRSSRTSPSPDADLRERETEEDRVAIMTMHIAKGLEFPVVFVPWGFGKIFHATPSSAVLDLPDGSHRRVFGIDGKTLGEPWKKAAKETSVRETRRLLYVALTRACLKLYLPWSRHASEKGFGSSGSALLGGFLSQAILRHFGSPEAAAAAVATPADGRPALSLALSADFAPFRASLSSVAPPPLPAPVPLDLPSPAVLAANRLRWDSFSSLHAAVSAAAATPDLPPDPARPEGDARVLSDESDPALPLPLPPDDSAVPRGTLSGTVFHDLMEALCNGADAPGSPGFQSIGNAPDFDALWADPASGLAPLVARFMRARGLPDRSPSPGRSTARALARMAWAALRAPLPFPDGPARLADIALADRRAEVSFVVSETLAAGPAAAPRPGAFNGSVDLLFRAAPGRPFYILDWKTNALPDYTPASAAAAMDACGYRLQYRLYALAVADWLGPANLAGAAYLFVRGGEFGPGPAVFAEPFPPGWRAAFRASLPPLP